MNRGNSLLTWGLILLAPLLWLAGLTVGSQLLGWPLSDTDQAIMLDLRLPRSLGAWLAGACLGLAGAVAQGLFRNPLADPYLLGSASGAALGVVLVLGSTFGTLAAPGLLLQVGVTGAAFIGAAFAVVLALLLGGGSTDPLRLLLAGVVTGMLLHAVALLSVIAQPAALQAMQSFLLGQTSLLGWPSVGWLAGTLMLALIIALPLGRALDALQLGERSAASLGIPVGAIRFMLLLVLALATASSVAQAGAIAFVGLLAPNLIRLTGAHTQRRLLYLSALAGGALLCMADLLARSLMAPHEIPVGVVTALIGGTYLLLMLSRLRGRP
jgi:iron complex transport system permease protein